MKVIFLDIDGVLATPESYKQRRRLRKYVGERWQRFRFYGLSQECIDHLNTLADTGAVIIISSTWRHGTDDDFADLKEYLTDLCGIKLPIIDRTPQQRKKFSSKRARGQEIREWLDLHPEVTHFVVFDDDTGDMDEVEDHFVHIEGGWQCFDAEEREWRSGKGLQIHHVRRAREILEENL